MSAIKEHMDLKIEKRKSDFHVELGTRRKEKDESDVCLIVEILDEWVPDLYSKGKPLTNIAKGYPATEALVSNTKSLMCRGEKERNAFFSRIANFGY